MSCYKIIMLLRHVESLHNGQDESKDANFTIVEHEKIYEYMTMEEID